MTDTPRNGKVPKNLGGERLTGDGAEANLRRGIEAFVARVVRETGVPGVAVAIRARGRQVLVGAGRAERDGRTMSTRHRFHAGCTIKLLLAVIALELANRGRLSLDDAIGEPLPELRGTVHGKTVRVSHLLSHTSGYRGTQLLDPATRDLDWAGLIAHVRAAPQLFVPGSVFSYEHTESVLLGRILERATGRDPLDLAREMLLEPLGIAAPRVDAVHGDPLWAGRHDLDRASGRFVQIEDLPALSPFWNAAFSNFTLSTADLAAVAAALLPAPADALAGVPTGEAFDAPLGSDDLRSPVSDETRARLRQEAVRLPPVFGGPIRELLPVAFGLGAAEFPAGLHGHNGLTYGQCVALRYSPAHRFAVAIGMNAMLPHLRDHVLDAICTQLAGRASTPRPAQPELGFELGELGGRYVGPGRSRVTATHAAGRLELCIEHAEQRLSIELVVGEDRRPIVRSPLPQLAVGFFRTPAGDVGLMLGVNAYKRVSSARRGAPAAAPTGTAPAEAGS